MTELKTLKDMQLEYTGDIARLKAEAVKWYEYFQEKYEREDFTDFGGELSSWIKHFFSLTEQDLEKFAFSRESEE